LNPKTPTRDQILAASSAWVAVALNVVPGLGTGYLYQRRWRAYWITAVGNGAWLAAGALFSQGSTTEMDPKTQLIGLLGLSILGIVTAIEAGQTVKKVRQAGSQK
tara:strand:+ start:1981 stop:2295 length:315 start_codon:yes stop_codon:yes gene_type:complete